MPDSPQTTPAAPRRPGRPPSEELAVRRRAELVEAAYEVFAERGYTAAGIADIAERLGIGHGTFYRYFESKRDILDHVIDYGVDRIVTAVQRDVSPESANSAEELAAQFGLISERIFALIDEEPNLVRVILLEATSIDDELTYRVLGLLDSISAITATYLDHGVREGYLRADLDTRVVAEGINALIVPGFLRVVRGSFDAAARERFGSALITMVFNGIRA